MSTQQAFITSSGSFLPGPPICNDEIESILGLVNGKPSRLKQKILRANGIKTRHYALNHNQQSTYQCSELAAQAALHCLNNAFADSDDIDLLAVGSTQGDLPLPGLASMVQAELDIPACEIVSTHGVCSSGVMALKAAANQVKLGEKQTALVCASELASRLLKKSRYEAAKHEALDLEAEFLRWMLSDGAGALLVESKPRPRGISLRIDWIEVMSYASDFDLCMSCGTADQSQWSAGHYSPASAAAPSLEKLSELQQSARKTNSATLLRERSWQDYETYADAERSGALLLRQNLRILDNIVKVGVEGFLRLIKQGKVKPEEIDYFVCHYSSHTFRGKIVDLLTRSGCMVPEEKWFTNLYTKGNTGCASIFIMLDELYQSGELKEGQTLFCTIPESGRFTTAYMKLTVVGGKQ
ncbi:MAG: beta-ketoacyl-ACP synthase III [Candidatus Obscuribacterales bacterium]|nr:MAG: 3-oxoacyl-ACP synthase [Candidatus Melainabacteria bacterium]